MESIERLRKYANGPRVYVLAEHGWYRVLDADGVPIRVGDRMDTERGTEEVEGILPGRGRFLVLRDNQWLTLKAATHHHHEPTVEDVLREFGRGWHEQMNAPETFDIADYVERYAEKLRLAGDV